MRIQKTIVTAASAAVSLMFVAGTLIPAVYGAAAPGVGDSCALRTELTQNEALALDPNYSTTSSNAQLYAAGTVLRDPNSPSTTGTSEKDWGIFCTYTFMKGIANLVFLVVGAISVAMIAYAAFLFIFEGANPGKESQARAVLLGAVIGIVVALVARLIPTVLVSVIGVSH